MPRPKPDRIVLDEASIQRLEDLYHKLLFSNESQAEFVDAKGKKHNMPRTYAKYILRKIRLSSYLFA